MPQEENNSDFDARITEFKSDLKKRQDKASLLMEKIVNILTDYSEVWYENTATSIIKGNYDITLSLNKDTLKRLKNDIQGLIESSKTEIKKELTKEEYWPEYYGLKKSRKLDEGLRLIFGKLAEVLGNYGYIKNPDVWHESAESKEDVSKSPFFYPYGLELPEEFLSLYDEYKKLSGEIQGLKRNIFQLDREKKEEMALKLWETV